MKVLGRIFLNSRKDRRKDVKTERRKDVKTERRKDVKTERRSFFVSCRRTYILKKKNNTYSVGRNFSLKAHFSISTFFILKDY